MAISSRSPVVFLQRTGLMEPVPIAPVRRVAFRELGVNAQPVLVDEALPMEILDAERQLSSNRTKTRDWKILGSVVVPSV